MNQEFVPYELALKLKQLGFDESCFVFWTNTPKYKGDNIQLCITDGMHGYSPNSISFKQDFLREGEVLAPLYQQAFRWFREMGFLIHFSSHDHNIHDFYIKWSPEKSILSDAYDTYEEAELACLDKLIEIAESKQEG